MNKIMKVVAASSCAVLVSGSAYAAEEVTKADAEVLEEEESSIFEAGVDIDLYSAYIWRNVVQTDTMVLQPCVWLDFTFLDPVYFGFSYWQNWDLTNDRRETFKHHLNESDYNLHVGVTAWENEDEDMSLEFEVGHDWYTYHFTRRYEGQDTGPSSRELYLKGRFANPIVDVYGQISWMYDEIQDCDPGFCYELGFNHEFELYDTLSLGLDWNTSFVDKDYNCFMTGYYERGFLGTTIKAYLTWQVTDWMAFVGTIAYTGILNPNTRDDFNADGISDDKDILWGGFSAKFSF